jgi:hypothetical protein
MAQRKEVKPMADKNATNETASAVTEHDEAAARDERMQEAFANLDRIMEKLDPAVREELKDKPEALAEWDEIMRDHGDILTEEAKEAEEAKLQKEIDEHIAQLAAEVDWLASLDVMDLQTNLEVEETLARNFATWNELDAIMRLRARDFPDKLARWEEEVMKPMRRNEAIFEAGVAATNARPEN